MALSVATSLLMLYVSCETIRANFAYFVFHNFPQISASLMALFSECLKLAVSIFFLLRAHDGFIKEEFTKITQEIQLMDLEGKKIVKYTLPATLYLANNLIFYTVLPKTSPSLLQVCVLA
ncbi:hypothetical protein B0J14DRAFT_686919 [Halenospora varia]|nr:hypothetical protein B0J14DRAFT_686919 [Halenospora varia]